MNAPLKTPSRIALTSPKGRADSSIFPSPTVLIREAFPQLQKLKAHSLEGAAVATLALVGVVAKAPFWPG